jgi:hypothetical protein
MPLKFGKVPDESYADIYHSLFDWVGNNREDIIGWIEENIEDSSYWRERYYHLKDLLEMKLQQEVMEKYVGDCKHV